MSIVRLERCLRKFACEVGHQLTSTRTWHLLWTKGAGIRALSGLDTKTAIQTLADRQAERPAVPLPGGDAAAQALLVLPACARNGRLQVCPASAAASGFAGKGTGAPAHSEKLCRHSARLGAAKVRCRAAHLAFKVSGEIQLAVEDALDGVQICSFY